MKYIEVPSEVYGILVGIVVVAFGFGPTISPLNQEAGVGLAHAPKTLEETSAKELDKQIRQAVDEIEKRVTDRNSYDEEILWFARAVYSESKRADEQEMVAWVVRNRVESCFRGHCTYKETVLAPKQFSGLNPTDRRYHYNITRDRSYEATAWATALLVAERVYHAPETQRPFAITVRHFYSPHAVSAPKWASGREATYVIKGANEAAPRFAFYSGVK